jgi:hypothetical protein
VQPRTLQEFLNSWSTYHRIVKEQRTKQEVCIMMKPSRYSNRSFLLLLICCLPEETQALQQSRSSPFASLKQIIKAVVNSRIYRPIHNKLWPNTLADLYYEEPLPPGPLGCPWKGFNAKQSDPSFGPGVLFYRIFEKLQRPQIYKFFSQSKGIAIVSGYANSKAVLTQEFDKVVSQVVPFTYKLVGESSLQCSRNRKEHVTLQKLLGMAVQPASVSKLIKLPNPCFPTLFKSTKSKWKMFV